MRRKRWDDSPNDWGAARDYAMALGTLGDARAAAGLVRQACADYAETLEVFDRMRTAGRLAKLDEENGVRSVRSHIATYCKSPATRP